jgi:transposase
MSVLCPIPNCDVVDVRRIGPATTCVAARGRADHGRCPECGRVSAAVHSRYGRRPADLPSLGREIRLSVQVRRFYCRNGACPRRTFAEQLPGLLAPYARRTRRLGRAQGRVGVALGGECATTIVVPGGRRLA